MMQRGALMRKGARVSAKPVSRTPTLWSRTSPSHYRTRAPFVPEETQRGSEESGERGHSDEHFASDE
jgi:hypothetical protein